ncbi:hypothetical protein CEXT_329731 [Caerostris extrusa]|uniref:Uncharacterized protein n=1 Tax=Caerostris extrusa TaxID=172846 RepID=A0AAV4PXA2_CAEEX|nr:hypothetical protein CEXT_329731 [Caerostris extrusa]
MHRSPQHVIGRLARVGARVVSGSDVEANSISGGFTSMSRIHYPFMESGNGLAIFPPQHRGLDDCWPSHTSE